MRRTRRRWRRRRFCPASAPAISISSSPSASEVVPTTQETLNDIRKSMQRIEKMTPLVEDTFREYRDLGHKLNNAVPDLRQTNADVDKLAQSANKAMEQAQDAIPRITRDADDAAAAARAFQKLSERVDNLLLQNQDQITQSITRLNEVLTRTAALLSDDNVRNVTDIIRNVRTSSETFPEPDPQRERVLEGGPQRPGPLQRDADPPGRPDAEFAEDHEAAGRPQRRAGPQPGRGPRPASTAHWPTWTSWCRRSARATAR